MRTWFAQLFQQPQLNEIILWISLTFIISPVSSQFKVLLQRDLLFNQLAFQEVVSKLAEAIVAITLAFLGYRVWSLVVGYLFGVTTNTLILLFIGFKKYRPRLRFKFSEIRKYLTFGMYQMANNTISILAMKVDQIIIGRLLGVQTLGIYYFASNLAHQPISKIAPIFKKVLFPVFSKIQAETDKLQSGFLKLNKMLMFVLSPIAMGVIVLAPKWVVPIFGHKWIETITIIQLLAFLELLKTPGSTYSSLVLAKGKPKSLFIWSIFQFILRVISIYFAAKIYGINGVIYILVIIQIVGMVPSYLILVKPFVELCFLTFLKAICKPFFASILMAIFVLIVSKLVKVNYIY
jgi:PST family polysaccharide transporter/lipopolysaccharide exporter